MEDASKQIALRLKIARKTAGYKRAKNFALTHKIPFSTYSQHETGKRPLSAELLLKYGEILEINPSWLLTGKGHPCPGSYSEPARNLLIESEVEALSTEGIFPTPEFPTISAEDTDAVVNMKLFKKILLQVASLLADKKLALDRGELVDFCIDIYNNIIGISDEKNNRDLAIQLSIHSLTTALEKSFKQEQNRK